MADVTPNNDGADHSATLPLGDGAMMQESVDWRRRMSDHIAFALLVYTALQIFVTVALVREANGSLLPYLALIVLVAAIIPACRMFEKRWGALTDEDARSQHAAAIFRRDRVTIWMLAIGLPLLITVAFKAVLLANG